MLFTTLIMSGETYRHIIKQHPDMEIERQVAQDVAAALEKCAGESQGTADHSRCTFLEVCATTPVSMFVQVALSWTPARARMSNDIQWGIRDALQAYCSEGASIQVFVNIAVSAKLLGARQIELGTFLANTPREADGLFDCLHRAGYDNLGDVLEHTREDLRALEGMTVARFGYLMDLLLRGGWSLQPSR